MPYALFSKDAKLSKAYPTEADVWKYGQKSGLVVDVVSEQEKAAPLRCWIMNMRSGRASSSPQEDPARNKADAEREAQTELQLAS